MTTTRRALHLRLLLQLVITTACMGKAQLLQSESPASAPGPQQESGSSLAPFAFQPDPSFSTNPPRSSPAPDFSPVPSTAASPSLLQPPPASDAGVSSGSPMRASGASPPAQSPDAYDFISPALAPSQQASSLKALPPSAGGHRRGEYQAVFNVNDFGAVGNGVRNDTQAFIKTWQRACRQRQSKTSMMLVPSGKVYLVYPLTLKGPCQNNISLQIAGKIIAPATREQWKGFDIQTWILIKKVTNFRLFGAGSIDGRGENWWTHSCKRNKNEPCRRAPTALTLRRCQQVEVDGLTITNSQQMHLDLSACSNVVLRYVTVRSPEESPNTDGIHLERSQGVLISQASISTGDDCISIGPGTSNVVIENIACGPGHGISIGSLGKKRQSFDRVTHVRVQNAFLRNTLNGLRIKTWEGGQGWAHDFVFEHVTMENVKNPILIDQFYCDDEHSGTCTPKMVQGGPKQGLLVSNVVYSDVRGSSASQVAVMFRCNPTNPCHKITLDNVVLEYKNREASSICQNAYGSSEKYVLPPTCLQSESKYRASTWSNRNGSRHA